MDESGHEFYGKYVHFGWNWHTEDNVRYNSCGGGDDAYVDFYYIPETVLFDAEVSSENAVTWAQIYSLGGLNGGYYCVGGYCTASVCTTQAPGSNPASINLYTP